MAVYASTKAALAALTKNAAHAHRFDRIRANAINVGWVDTPAEREMQAVKLGKGEGWLEEAAAEPAIRPADDARRRRAARAVSRGRGVGLMTGAVIDQEQFVIGAFG